MSGQLVADSENFRRKNERVGMVVIRTSLSSLPINGTVRGEGIRIGLHSLIPLAGLFLNL